MDGGSCDGRSSAAPGASRVELCLEPLSASSVSCTMRLNARHDGEETVPLSIRDAREACAAAKDSPLPDKPVESRCLCVHGKVSRLRSMGHITFVDLVEHGASSSNDRLQVIVSRSELCGGLRGLALPLLLRRLTVVSVVGIPGVSASGEPSLFARSLRLLRLPADPACILKAARLVASTAELPIDLAASAIGCEPDELFEIACAFEAESGAELDAPPLAIRLTRELSSRLRNHQRERRPRFAQSELTLVRQLREQFSNWAPVRVDALAPLDEVVSTLVGPLSPECGLPDGLAPADREVRLAYLRDKKVPQLRWMLHQVRELLAARSGMLTGAEAAGGARNNTVSTVVDLGCGKGDFTLLLAAAMGKRVSVLGVDTNAGAIATARARATAAGLQNVHFRIADANDMPAAPTSAKGASMAEPDVAASAHEASPAADEFTEDGHEATRRWHPGRQAALLVGLHACGGLSDVALRLAAGCGASCLLATCCFGKHRELCPADQWHSQLGDGQKDVLCRMADCVDTERATEARTVVSNLRLNMLRREMRSDVRLAGAAIRTFDPSYSRQNVVLAVNCQPCD